MFPFSVPSPRIGQPSCLPRADGGLWFVAHGMSSFKTGTVPRNHDRLPGAGGLLECRTFAAETSQVLYKSRTSGSSYFFPAFPPSPRCAGQQPVVTEPQAVPSEGGESSVGKTQDGTSVLSCLKAGMGEKAMPWDSSGTCCRRAGLPEAALGCENILFSQDRGTGGTGHMPALPHAGQPCMRTLGMLVTLSGHLCHL